MTERDVLLASLLEDACLTLDQLASACDVETAWLVERVEAGLLDVHGLGVEEWRFRAAALSRVRRMCQIERDFDAVPELAALVADLLEEIERLRGYDRRGSKDSQSR
jgi:chaperone modulatory protein CbpM